jgi:Antitoxin Xre-like helix-turn-helix domain/Antitoxin Xre/MbcA/ParS C-terminal toxin-binding domain
MDYIESYVQIRIGVRSVRIADHRPSVTADRKYSSAEKARAGLTAFFSIAGEWGLDNEQQRVLLGGPGRTTFFDWKRNKAGNLSRDMLDRLSYLLGIYKALHILFSDRTAREWIKNPNADPLFNGRSPLDYMLSGQLVALADVRRYLDWARG